MLIINSLIAVFLAFGNAPAADHEFKMSVTEIVYSAETKAFEVKFYLFTDDLTATISGSPTAPLPSRDAISQYILKHFELIVNGSKQVLTFQAFRQKNDQVLATFSTPVFTQKSIAKIAVRNSLLVEKFGEQTNMVYAILPGKSRLTQLLDKSKVNGVFEF